MPSSRSRSRLVIAAGVVALSLVACSSVSDDDQSVATTASEVRLSGSRYLGAIGDGQTRTVSYSEPPPYRSLGFDAVGGDEVTVTVASPDRDAVVWITDANYNVLAYNDDEEYGTLNAKVFYKVPSGLDKRSYRIVLRDFDLQDARFAVALTIAKPHCDYNGVSYAVGQSFPAPDGCNTCTCNASGVTCGQKQCVCDPDNEPWRNYVGTPATCPTIRYTCQDGTRPFQNACGCGCERPQPTPPTKANPKPTN